MKSTTITAPVSPTERAEILDILRGIALFGICLANFPVFSLYVFQEPEVLSKMSTATIDLWMSYFHFTFIDGKFYSIFSLLFGIGFSIILSRSTLKGVGLGFFYRRIFILLFMGLAHSLLLWEGDILLLYALIGLLLPLFRNVSDKNLLLFWVILIMFPIIMDTMKVVSDNKWNISNPLVQWGIAIDKANGINEVNWRTWFVDHSNYSDILKYNQSGVIWRYQGLLDNNRFFKVLGMFLLGLYAGRKLLFRNLNGNKILLKKVQWIGFSIGLPVSGFFAYFSLDDHHLPAAFALWETIAYALSVVPLSLAYASTICLWFLKDSKNKFLTMFSATGRMALTNYIFQTIFGILIFYGIGIGLGAKTGLVYVIIIAVIVYIIEMICSHIWLKYFNYGPLEWIWRQFTYGRILPLKKLEINSF